MSIPPDLLSEAINLDVSRALDEDIGSGDITASLIPEDARGKATIISREDAVLCGKSWANEAFQRCSNQIQLDWQSDDGEQIAANQVLVSIEGPLRAILTAERTALNFLQLLSGIATNSARHAAMVSNTSVKLLDTRKTLPGLRIAQKYAVATGGCHNHRLGLFDAFLIKENHIAACGSISAAVATARKNFPDRPVEVEVEVENHQELAEALEAGADIIMLDNFSIKDMVKSVEVNAGRARLEASGNIDDNNLLDVANTGVDFISMGSLTKHCRAIDLSLRLE